MLKPNDKAPQFCLPDAQGNSVCLENFQGQWVILYFYPKDDTTGCTLEAIDFTRIAEKVPAKIIGISADSCESHKKFTEKHNLGISLLSDTDKIALIDYGTWQKKHMAGREYMGIVRSTFIISPDQKIHTALYNVKAKGHADKVAEILAKQLSS